MCPASAGNAPLSCSIFSLAIFHKPFCAIIPPISNSSHNLLYSFLVILFFVLPSFTSLLPWQGSCRLQEPVFVSTFCRPLLCPRALACSHSSIWVTFSASHSPSIFCTRSKLLPACQFFASDRVLPSIAFPTFPNSSSDIWSQCMFLACSCTCCLCRISCNEICWHLHTTPFGASFPHSFYSQRSFWLRLVLFTVFPFLHQAVKTGCIPQSCSHLP